MNDSLRTLQDLAKVLGRVYDTVQFVRPLGRLPRNIGMPDWVAPTLALGALLSLVVLSGIALASLATLVTSLFVAAMILDAVFGIAVEIAS